MAVMAKLYRLLGVLFFSLIIFEAAAPETEAGPEKVSDNEVLKIIGADPVPAETKNKSTPQPKQRPAKSDFPRPGKNFKIHTVKPGETLGIISRAYYGDGKQVSLIAEYNNIKNINQIHIGQKIKIPMLVLKKPKNMARLEEADLGGAEISAAGPIKEADMNKRRLFGKPILVLIAIALLTGVLIFLVIKLRSLKNPVDKVSIEEGGPFTLGHVDAGPKKTKVWRFTRRS